jgi:hypothetical protein
MTHDEGRQSTCDWPKSRRARLSENARNEDENRSSLRERMKAHG